MSAIGQPTPQTGPTGGSVLAAALDEVTNPNREQQPSAPSAPWRSGRPRTPRVSATPTTL